MQNVFCLKHKEEFSIPTKDEEFESGVYHENIELCLKHYEKNPSCKFVKEEDKN